MFDSHPEIAIPPESYFLVSFGSNASQYESDEGVDIERFIASLFRSKRFGFWKLSEPEVRKALVAAQPARVEDALRSLYLAYARSKGKERYGDKTPYYALQIPLLAGLFPESRFIHIIRDGRNVALSTRDDALRNGPVKFTKIGALALHWGWYVSEGRKGGRSLDENRYCEVYYEDLIEDPESILRKLCSFADLTYNSSMLNYVERAEELASSFFYPQLQRSLFYPPTKGLRDWRNQMSRPDLTLFELVAGDLLTELGYARATKGGNLRMRLIAAQWRWAFRVRHSYGFPHLARRTLRKLARWAWPNRRFTAAARAEG